MSITENTVSTFFRVDRRVDSRLPKPLLLMKGHTMPKHTPAEKKKIEDDKKKKQAEKKKAFPGAARPFTKK